MSKISVAGSDGSDAGKISIERKRKTTSENREIYMKTRLVAIPDLVESNLIEVGGLFCSVLCFLHFALL